MSGLIDGLKNALPSLKDALLASGLELKKKTNNELSSPCPFCGGDDRFTYFIDSERGFCRQCDFKGDSIEFHKQILKLDLKGLAAHQGIMITKTAPKNKGGNGAAGAAKIKKETTTVKDAEKKSYPSKRSYAWQQATAHKKNIPTYFNTRSINFNGKISPAIRYGEYTDKKTKETVRMVVCAVTKPTDNAVYAVQRIFLDENLEKAGKPKMLGEVKGRAVWFNRKDDKKILLIGEGIESTLAAMQATKLNGAAGLSSKNMQNIIFPDETQTIHILVDQDKNHTGQNASIALAGSFEASQEGREAYLITPEDVDKCFIDQVEQNLDINDVLMKSGQDAVVTRFNEKVRLKSVTWRSPSKDNTSSGGGSDPYYTDQALYELDKINKEYALVSVNGKVRVLRENRRSTGNSIQFLEKMGFQTIFENKNIFVQEKKGIKPIQLGNAWMKWRDRRTYFDVDFMPGGTDDKSIYNLFRGFPVKPVKGDWSKMLEHIEEIICDGNREHADYLLDWMARIVQQPGGDRPGVAVVLKSGKGSGKGLFVRYFGQLFGDSFSPITNSQGFMGRFNSHIAKALLVFLDEAIWAGDKQQEGSLKGFITEPTVQFEAKGINPVTLPNYINVVIASNEDWVCPTTIDERRFFVLSPSSSKKGDGDYFNALVKEWEGDGPAAMYYDLMNRKFSMDKLRKAPKTDALAEQLEHSLNEPLQFWMNVLSRGFLLSDMEGKPVNAMNESEQFNWPRAAFKSEIYHEFKARFCNNRQYTEGERQFWKKSRQLLDNTKGCSFKQIRINGSPVRIITLPELDIMCDCFGRLTGIKIDGFKYEVETDTPF